MFTGIVEELGTVESSERRGDVVRVRITARTVLEGLGLGGSIAVNGCCLTAVDLDGGGFTCELTGETLTRTAFEERLQPGVRVNLERPLRADGRFDGHLVQGHVDGVGRVRGLHHEGASAVLAVEPPAALERYLVVKGSVAVDGVSLTVAGLDPGAFTVALIPYTLGHTNLGGARPGDRVNLEADVIAKYVERMLEPRNEGA
jgi:riboflavin synthase